MRRNLMTLKKMIRNSMNLEKKSQQNNQNQRMLNQGDLNLFQVEPGRIKKDRKESLLGSLKLKINLSRQRKRNQLRKQELGEM